jgi:hypothetical protein
MHLELCYKKTGWVTRIDESRAGAFSENDEYATPVSEWLRKICVKLMIKNKKV